ncbi:Protein of unknown function [Gryllus bimaculatus]|nr:Protein of unknown function [Gryllus bimaculatus]
MAACETEVAARVEGREKGHRHWSAPLPPPPPLPAPPLLLQTATLYDGRRRPRAAFVRHVRLREANCFCPIGAGARTRRDGP